MGTGRGPVGRYFGCGVLEDAASESPLVCWNPGETNAFTPEPEVPSDLDVSGAIAISVSTPWACVLDASGSPECWSLGDGDRLPVGDTVPLALVDCAEYGCCGVSEEGEIACWSFDDYWEQFDPPGSYDVSSGPVND